MDQGQSSGSGGGGGNGASDPAGGGNGASDPAGGGEEKMQKYRKLIQNGFPCAPFQRCQEDVPVAFIDIGGVEEHDIQRILEEIFELALTRLNRARKIGPALYYGKPITPRHNLWNPKSEVYPVPEDHKKNEPIPKDPTSGHSFHIIELLNGKETSMRVQLLIRDYDLYLVAFRRLKNGEWSSWYRYTDAPVPDYFNAIDMGITGEHDKETLVGGTTLLNSMFYALVNYPENRDNDGVKKALLRAVIMFCEGLRFRTTYKIVKQALQYDMNPFELDLMEWDAINSWGSLSEFVLSTGMKQGNMDKSQFDKVVKRHTDSFMNLVGHGNSLLMHLMRNDEVLLPKGNMPEEMKKKLKASRDGRGLTDPRFKKPAEDDWKPTDEEPTDKWKGKDKRKGKA